MKSHISAIILILSFSSCITSDYVNYSDPNYLNSNEFSTYEEMTANNQLEQDALAIDTTDPSTNYKADDYYDYSFSSRLRRFHRPIYYSGYYDGIYTDYYWYTNDPFACGTSIYFGYNWLSPYYSYYSYSPYYLDYYSPYYEYHYANAGHLYNHHTYTYYNNRNYHNAYVSGPRTSLSSTLDGRSLNTNNTKIKSTPKIRAGNDVFRKDYKTKTTSKKNTTDRRYTKIKTNQRNHSITKDKNRGNRNNNNTKTIKANSNRENTSYSTPSKHNRPYKARGSRGKGSVKPRR